MAGSLNSSSQVAQAGNKTEGKDIDLGEMIMKKHQEEEVLNEKLAEEGSR